MGDISRRDTSFAGEDQELAKPYKYDSLAQTRKRSCLTIYNMHYNKAVIAHYFSYTTENSW